MAYRLGEKTADPLSMYVGDLMTVNVNLARARRGRCEGQR